MQFAAIFSIIIGIGMIGQWGVSYAKKQIPELKTEPIRIWFHIVAEMVTAILLIIGGTGLIAQLEWGTYIFLISMGMLFYTAIVSPGYFAQRGQWSWLIMFSILIVMGMMSILFVLL